MNAKRKQKLVNFFAGLGFASHFYAALIFAITGNLRLGAVVALIGTIILIIVFSTHPVDIYDPDIYTSTEK